MIGNKYKYINLDYLELMADGDLGMKQVMLEMLIEELPVEMAKMEKLVEEGNMKELKAVSHKFKSTLSFVGNDIFTEANKDLEQIAQSNSNLPKLPSLLVIMVPLCENVLIELKVELSKL